MKKILLPLFVAVLLFGGCSHIRMGVFLLKSNPTENDPQSVSRGKGEFEKTCSGCHGMKADGAGPEAEGLTATPTNFTAAGYSKSAARLAARINYGKGEEMPAFSDKLSSDTIWDLANYLQSLQKH